MSSLHRGLDVSAENLWVCFFTDSDLSSAPLSPTRPQTECELCIGLFIPWTEGVPLTNVCVLTMQYLFII